MLDIVSDEFNGFIPRQEWVVSRIVSSASGFTLDLGCGIGLWSKIARRKERVEVIGVDISRERLKYAKVVGNNDLIICASSTHLPFKPRCFDSVLFVEVIEHLSEEDQVKTLGEIHRILKQGVLIVTTPNKPIYHLLSKVFHLFRYNSEHVNELSLWEFRNLVMKYFKIISINGKISSRIFRFS